MRFPPCACRPPAPILNVSLLLIGLVLASALVRAGPSESSLPAEIRLIEGDVCDDRNKRLWLENTHRSRTFAVLVQWRAAGGKELTEKVFVTPGVMIELGCAAESKILEAAPTDF